jgi:hypothetical protein
MAESFDIEDMRATLARVSIYRKVQESVRSTSGNTIFSGVIYLGFGYYLYSALGGLNPFVIAIFALGAGEVLVGLLKRIAPMPECILLDALLEFAFVAYLVYRNTNGFAIIPQKPSPFFVIIGIWATFNGIQHLRSYMQLRSIFKERPTRAHIAYVDDLTNEIEAAQPATDPTALDVPTKPPLQIKMMGDIALVLESSSRELFLCARRELDLERDGDRVRLTILREDYPPCRIDEDSWRNYVNWKSAG